jgi:uncharacterized membrane protein YphA (DoxX/SURF4 family)
MSGTLPPTASEISQRSPAGHLASRGPGPALAVLRIGLGLIWTLNLVFILDPANEFFSSFASTASSFGPSSLGGPGFAELVAANSTFFSVVIAVTTAYLAVAFLLGATTRVACVVGLVFNSVLFITQFGSTVFVPGGTDVGPMPIYIVAYLAIVAAGVPTLYSLDAWWATRRGSVHGITSPAPVSEGV